ncbi:hypothetical protein H4J57_11885 [Colwellia sp. BRX8-7]|jgi:hypothetical protein|uniref:hypothetical protein n=1 Tax=Colwellia sp. BRX8-7 TaxID=2759833 RepID=UPI0015F66BB7|nr:hypothetical protein [Colwellia sp. BRX8-7]MBA6337898.1 hypothetical protein [Colwellia sp. BRX8-7]
MLKAWLTNKATQLFFVLWLHISLLNLFFVNKRGIVFLWQQNSEINTLLIHFITALIAALIYIAVTKIRIGLAEKKLTMGNHFFVVGSVVMVLLIGFFLFSS